MKKIACPICGGEFEKGYTLGVYGSRWTVCLKTVKGFFGKRYDIRARMCLDCGHVDFYVPKSQFEKVDS